MQQQELVRQIQLMDRACFEDMIHHILSLIKQNNTEYCMELNTEGGSVLIDK
jgi:hypothetical protein